VALMEAMAAGRAVVSTSVSGIPELVHDNVTGRLVAPGDPVALADALEELLADPERAARLGAEGRRLVTHDFDLRTEVSSLASIFQALVDGHAIPIDADGRVVPAN
jgi:starch synthase